MKLEKMGTWLQIGGNIGLLVGLFFVGYQLMQERELKSLEIISQTFTDTHARVIASMGEEPYKAIVKAAYQPSELTPEESYIYKQYLALVAINWDRAMFLEERGFWDSSWQNILGMSAEYRTELGLSHVVRMLDRDYFPPEFAAKLRAEIQTSEFTTGFKDHIEGAIEGE